MWRGTKEPPGEGEREEWKSQLKTKQQKQQQQQTKIMVSIPITSWKIEGGKVEVVTEFLFLGSKIAVDGDLVMKSEDACFLAGKLWQT